MEEKDKVEKREKIKSAQENLRTYLDVQMKEKEQQKQALKEADTLLKQQQATQLEQWNREQQAKKDVMSQKTQAIQRERDEQTAVITKRREEERNRKLEEDHMTVTRAEQELNREKDKILQKKIDNRRREQEAEKEVRAHMALKNLGSPGREVYSEENIMKYIAVKNERAEEADRQKREMLKKKRTSNKDYIVAQIEEKERRKRQEMDQKGNALTVAQEVARDYMKTEDKRIQAMRTKNVQYRIELEHQIEAQKQGRSPLNENDLMSDAERAINNDLLKEAQIAKKKLSHLIPQKSSAELATCS